MPARDAAPDAAEATAEPASWRELAVARSLDPARARAEKRVQRFLDAALELMGSAPDKEFTVQEVVERSGQSLRSFYQYFAGKHELLLALFEESVRSTAAQLTDAMAAVDDPRERIHRFATTYYRLCRPSPNAKPSKNRPPIMAEFAQQLLTSHPAEASKAFAPLVALLVDVLDEAVETGVVRKGLNHPHIAGVILQAISFNVFATTISGAAGRQPSDTAAEELWDLIFSGIGTS